MAIFINAKKQKKRRQYLRNRPTYYEKILWRELRGSQLGFKFRRQQGINNYILDFYCPEVKLDVELDGEIHDYIKQQKHDKRRTKELEGIGIKVLRIKNEEIYEDIDDVLDRIISTCKKLKKT